MMRISCLNTPLESVPSLLRNLFLKNTFLVTHSNEQYVVQTDSFSAKVIDLNLKIPQTKILLLDETDEKITQPK